MLYNKNQFKKVNDKKVLHKIKKHWVTLSIAMLGLIGGGAVTATHVSANANTSNQNNNDQAANHSLNYNQLQNQQPKLVNDNQANHSNQYNVNNEVHNDQNSQSQNSSSNLKAIDITEQANQLHDAIIGNATKNNLNNQFNNSNIKTNLQSTSEQAVSPFKQSHNTLVNGIKAQKNNFKQNLGGTKSVGQIAINYIEPSDGDKLVISPTLVSDLDGQPFDADQYLQTAPEGYINQKIDTRYKVPTVFNGTQSLYVDVSKNNMSQKGYVTISFVNQDNHNEELNHMILSDSDGATLSYSDIEGYLLTPPNGYNIVNYSDFNASDPAHPTKPGKYLGGVNPNKFPLKYTSDVTPIDVEIVPHSTESDNSDNSKIGAPIYINYINQHGVNVDTPDEAHDFIGRVGATLNAAIVAPIPPGYHLDNPDHRMSFEFDNDIQHEIINVAGDDINPQFITINRVTNDGKTLSPSVIPITGKVGDAYGIDPNSINPTGYYADPHSNKKVTGMILPPDESNPNPHLSKSQFTFVYDTKPNQNSAAPIHFNYINQNGQNVNTISDDTSISGPIGSKIKPSDKAPVPTGYAMNPKQEFNTYLITNHEQTIPVFVNGNAVSDNVTIHRGEQIIGKNGQPTGPIKPLESESDLVSGEIGNTNTVNPSDFDPAGDDAANSDFNNNQITFTPSGVRPNTKTFVYNKSFNGKPMSDVSNYVSGVVVLEDQDNYNTPIGQFTVQGILGQSVNYSKYMNQIKELVPSDSTQYYLVNSNVSNSNLPFTLDSQNPNAVMYNGGTYPVMVGEYGNINLSFMDPDGESLQSDQLKQPRNSLFNAVKAINDFMNQNGNDKRYEVKDVTVKDDITNQSKQYSVKDLQNNPDAILYSKDLQDVTFTIGNKLQNTTITLEDETANKILSDTITLHGVSGQTVPISDWINKLPSGYTYDEANPKNLLLESLTYGSKGAVMYVERIPVTDTINFEDENTKQLIHGSDSVSGEPGQPIDFSKIQIPKGYEYDPQTTANAKYSYNGKYTVMVKPINNRVFARIKYEDITTGQLVGNSINVTGLEGSPVPYMQYQDEDGSFMPSGYHFVKMGTSDPQLKNGDVDIIMVEPNSSTRNNKSASASESNSASLSASTSTSISIANSLSENNYASSAYTSVLARGGSVISVSPSVRSEMLSGAAEVASYNQAIDNNEISTASYLNTLNTTNSSFASEKLSAISYVQSIYDNPENRNGIVTTSEAVHGIELWGKDPRFFTIFQANPGSIVNNVVSIYEPMASSVASLTGSVENKIMSLYTAEQVKYSSSTASPSNSAQSTFSAINSYNQEANSYINLIDTNLDSLNVSNNASLTSKKNDALMYASQDAELMSENNTVVNSLNNQANISNMTSNTNFMSNLTSELSAASELAADASLIVNDDVAPLDIEASNDDSSNSSSYVSSSSSIPAPSSASSNSASLASSFANKAQMDESIAASIASSAISAEKAMVSSADAAEAEASQEESLASSYATSTSNAIVSASNSVKAASMSVSASVSNEVASASTALSNADYAHYVSDEDSMMAFMATETTSVTALIANMMSLAKPNITINGGNVNFGTINIDGSNVNLGTINANNEEMEKIVATTGSEFLSKWDKVTNSQKHLLGATFGATKASSASLTPTEMANIITSASDNANQHYQEAVQLLNDAISMKAQAASSAAIASEEVASAKAKSASLNAKSVEASVTASAESAENNANKASNDKAKSASTSYADLINDANNYYASASASVELSEDNDIVNDQMSADRDVTDVINGIVKEMDIYSAEYTNYLKASEGQTVNDDSLISEADSVSNVDSTDLDQYLDDELSASTLTDETNEASNAPISQVAVLSADNASQLNTYINSYEANRIKNPKLPNLQFESEVNKHGKLGSKPRALLGAEANASVNNGAVVSNAETEESSLSTEIVSLNNDIQNMSDANVASDKAQASSYDDNANVLANIIQSNITQYDQDSNAAIKGRSEAAQVNSNLSAVGLEVSSIKATLPSISNVINKITAMRSMMSMTHELDTTMPKATNDVMSASNDYASAVSLAKLIPTNISKLNTDYQGLTSLANNANSVASEDASESISTQNSLSNSTSASLSMSTVSSLSQSASLSTSISVSQSASLSQSASVSTANSESTSISTANSIAENSYASSAYASVLASGGHVISVSPSVHNVMVSGAAAMASYNQIIDNNETATINGLNALNTSNSALASEKTSAINYVKNIYKQSQTEADIANTSAGAQGIALWARDPRFFTIYQASPGSIANNVVSHYEPMARSAASITGSAEAKVMLLVASEYPSSNSAMSLNSNNSSSTTSMNNSTSVSSQSSSVPASFIDIPNAISTITSYDATAASYVNVINTNLDSLNVSNNASLASKKSEALTYASEDTSLIAEDDEVLGSLDAQYNIPGVSHTSSFVTSLNSVLSAASGLNADASLIVDDYVDPLDSQVAEDASSSIPSLNSNTVFSSATDNDFNRVSNSSADINSLNSNYVKSAINSTTESNVFTNPTTSTNNSMGSLSVLSTAVNHATSNVPATSLVDNNSHTKNTVANQTSNTTDANLVNGVPVSVQEPIHWFYVDKTCLAHNHLSSVGKVKDYSAVLRPGTVAKVIKTFKVKYGKRSFLRYEIRINGKNYFVTGNNKFTKNEYIQSKELKHNHKIIIQVPCFMYNSPLYSSNHRVKKMHRGQAVTIKRIIKIGRKGHYMTRFELSNGMFITANRKFIKVI